LLSLSSVQVRPEPEVTISLTKLSGPIDEALEPVDPEVDVVVCGGSGGGASGARGGVGVRVPLLV
jgi:hypothetical protein